MTMHTPSSSEQTHTKQNKEHDDVSMDQPPTADMHASSAVDESVNQPDSTFQAQSAHDETSEPAHVDAEEKEQPISLKEIPGTSWSIVLTNKDHELFYNSETGQSTWEIPNDIVHVIGKLLEEAMAEELGIDGSEIDPANDAHHELQDEGQQPFPTESEAAIPSKESENITGPLQEEQGQREAASRQDHPKEDSNAKLSHSEKVYQFKIMLSELNLSPFSDWTLESSKIEHDERFKAIKNAKERRKIFEEYCMANAQTAAQNISTAHKASQEAFLSLLASEVKAPIGYAEFSRRFLRDPRFRNLSDVLTRERLFQEHLRKLKTKQLDTI